MRLTLLALYAALLPAAAAGAQAAGPAAISGISSSARHCLSGGAANIHNLGWIAAQSRYVVQFDADFGVTAAISRFEPTEHRATLIDGNPEFNGTASSSGTMVLHVSGNGGSGCYRYRVTIDPPAASATGEGDAVPERAAATDERRSDVSGPRAITGNPSSAQQCVSATVANVHEIGRIDQAGDIRITFDTDFSAVVGATLTTLDAAGSTGAFVVDPDTGGTRTPSLFFGAEAGENVVLFVTGANGASGCYKYKVEIR
jgi:hypothetical protein